MSYNKRTILGRCAREGCSNDITVDMPGTTLAYPGYKTKRVCGPCVGISMGIENEKQAKKKFEMYGAPFEKENIIKRGIDKVKDRFKKSEAQDG